MERFLPEPVREMIVPVFVVAGYYGGDVIAALSIILLFGPLARYIFLPAWRGLLYLAAIGKEWREEFHLSPEWNFLLWFCSFTEACQVAHNIIEGVKP